jgi:N utilization substance protein B|tara:strand:+ start:1030 stop:1539 length:510 start_codon:yes stop_codon:yes gene_type:complete
MPQDQTGQDSPANKQQAKVRRRRATRLAAIQALYQIEITNVAGNAVVAEFLQYRLREDLDGITLGRIDETLFQAIVLGVREQQEELDDMLTAVLADGWKVERLESLLRLILRAGTWELSNRLDIPAKAAITEYVDIAHGFFTGREPAMANGMLDKIARALREEDFEGAQ